MELEELNTVAGVIDKLGGHAVVTSLTGRKTESSARNWRAMNSFPPNTFILLTDALRAKGYTAPASLWRMVEPA